mmetsp:Transcript_76607/g.135156  ORF Transcript_76607/g.135156 Transcript_76607/m.135156 type:complete len:84 (+) Transcript_76607:1895-2146(+)
MGLGCTEVAGTCCKQPALKHLCTVLDWLGVTLRTETGGGAPPMLGVVAGPLAEPSDIGCGKGDVAWTNTTGAVGKAGVLPGLR